MGDNTDLTDNQWSLISQIFESKKGRHLSKHTKRDLVNAVLYFVKTGCQWRLLPNYFPPHDTVGSFYRRKPTPTYGIIDSQSAKTTATSQDRGIDGGGKSKGRKRHIVVDTMGNLLAITVHAANIHDTKSGIISAGQAFEK